MADNGSKRIARARASYDRAYAALIGTDGKEAIEPAGARLDPKKLHAAARTAWRFKDSPLLEDLRARCSDGAAALGGHCAET